MYKTATLVLAVLLIFGCATIQQPASTTTAEVEKPNTRVDYICSIPFEYFESMMGRIVVLGYEIDDPQYGEVRAHYAKVQLQDNEGNTYDYLFSIAWSARHEMIMTVAKLLNDGSIVVWLDRDANGIPEVVNDGGVRNQPVEAIDLEAYCKVVHALLQKPVYYPPSDEGSKEQGEQ